MPLHLLLCILTFKYTPFYLFIMDKHSGFFYSLTLQTVQPRTSLSKSACVSVFLEWTPRSRTAGPQSRCIFIFNKHHQTRSPKVSLLQQPLTRQGYFPLGLKCKCTVTRGHLPPFTFPCADSYSPSTEMRAPK